jgi:hypothetical protein
VSLLKKKTRIIIIAVLLILIVITGLFFVVQPQKTVAHFCQVAKDEKPVLTGDVNYERRLESYKKLEAASPDDIRPDISSIRKGYEEIVKNPSNVIGAGLGISGAESRRDSYINSNCKDF